ncbi:EAL domain-containing protein [Salmonella enterica]|nr:EAL domain-containing protein [Salmonella enterica]
MKVKSPLLFNSILLPLVLMSLLALPISIFQLKQDIILSANTLLRFSEDMSATSWRVTAKAIKLTAKHCGEILNELNHTRAFTPYIRDIGLLDNGYLTCSFVSGSRKQIFPFPEGKTVPVPLPEKWVSTSNMLVGGPGRPAIIYGKKATANKAAFVIVDALYVQELMNVLAAERTAKFSLQFGAGDVLISQPTVDVKPFMRLNYHVPAQQIYLSVSIPLSTITTRWLQNLFILIPVSLCLSFTSVFLYRRWQRQRLSLAKEIAKGIENEQFVAHYQPIYNVNRNRCGGVEALLRWPQPDGRFITPDIFITAAENEGMIVPLSRHLFRLVAQDVKRWRVSQGFYISVNISPLHLMHDDFITDVEQLINDLGKVSLMLELTERSLISNSAQVNEKLTLLRAKGVQIAIDDFGTGYCSLSYLQQLPANYLKIDRSFVDTIDTSSSDVPILDTIIVMSKKLGLNIVAEGVSSQHQLRYVMNKGVGYIQGFLYAKPMSSTDLMTWVIHEGTWEKELFNRK